MYHSQACTQSLEELTKLGVEDEEVDVEEEEEGEAHELSTISEEQGELWLSGCVSIFATPHTVHFWYSSYLTESEIKPDQTCSQGLHLSMQDKKVLTKKLRFYGER